VVIGSADVLVQTSDGESHTMVLGEAAFAGVAVATSNLEVLRHDGWIHGETCMMHKVGNVSMLASHLAYLFDHDEERARLASNVRRIRQGYCYDVFANRMMEMISSFDPARS